MENDLFCPNCKAEYRLGFTHCADCDVDLVESLPEVPQDPDSTDVELVDIRSPISLWVGTSIKQVSIVRKALSAAGIQFNTRMSTARATGRNSEYADAGAELMPADDAMKEYEVWIDASNSSAARQVLDTALASDEDATLGVEDETDLSAYLPESESGDGGDSDDVGEELDDDVLTAEAWSGKKSQMANHLKMCLDEVGLSCRIALESGNLRVLVAEQDIPRAQQVVREVVEGAVPDATEAE